MARPALPTAVKEASGAFKKNPQRRPKNEMTPDKGIGPAPKTLEHSDLWDEVVSAIPAGVLGNTDRIALEMLCKLIFKMRFDFENMTAAEMNRLETLLARFGMTPSDRQKITMPKQEKANPFEGM